MPLKRSRHAGGASVIPPPFTEHLLCATTRVCFRDANIYIFARPPLKEYLAVVEQLQNCSSHFLKLEAPNVHLGKGPRIS